MKVYLSCLTILLIASPTLCYGRLKDKISSAFKAPSGKPNTGRFLWFSRPIEKPESESDDSYNNYQVQRMSDEIMQLNEWLNGKCDKSECHAIEKDVEKLQMDIYEITNILSKINTRISLIDSIVDPCNRYLNFDSRDSSYFDARNNQNTSIDEKLEEEVSEFTGRSTGSDCVSVIAQPCCLAAQEALTAANAAQASANEAKTTADTALTTADDAKDLAEDANEAAGDAQTAAEEAQTTAEEAQDAAEDAQTAANAAAGAAAAAQNTADDAEDAAATAQTAANNAQEAAEDAQEAAEAAAEDAADALEAAEEEDDGRV